ncbi:MLO-like protein 11 [Nymphaea thermarum]|nr:MLO-like protein 11 [Nymphaea thermarum]
MKEELMLLGFISLLLAATSGLIASICIESKYYTSKFSPCTRSEAEDSAGLATENGSLQGRNLISYFIRPKLRRKLSVLHHNACKEASYQSSYHAVDQNGHEASSYSGDLVGFRWTASLTAWMLLDDATGNCEGYKEYMYY